MKDRIYHLRKEVLGMSRAKFGENVGMSDSEIKNIEYGITQPKDSKIRLICEKYGVSEQWLRTGEGVMYPPQTEDEALAAMLASIIAEGDPDKIRLAHILLDLLDDGWPLVEDRLKRLREGK